VARHVVARPPRAHWPLLFLFLLVLLAELCLNGYVSHAGSEGSGPTEPTGAGGAAPAAVTAGGPVQRVGADGSVTTRAMPARTIALTFDDGPDPQWTPQVLDVLAQYHAQATFFEIGSRVNQYPALSRRVLASGNEIGSHTFTHVQPGNVPGWRLDVELTLTRNAIAAATGRVPVLVRPPYSSKPDAVTGSDYAALRRVGASGYLVVLADLDTDDWRRSGVPAIVAAATPKDGAGAVVMMHDSGGDRTQTVAALRELLPRLQAQGYRFVTVSEALGLTGAPPATLSQRLRGSALRWAQVVGAWAARALTVFMLVAVVLAGLRLLVQVCGAWVHVRRCRRRARAPLEYLGPVSVIVPAYNEAANIAATVRSLVDSGDGTVPCGQ
jgi:peptidoglycan/xylan/chitin deacetylase (PgdA/CDA1 family)